MSSRVILAVAGGRISFLLWAEEHSGVCMHHLLFILSSTCRHSGCSHAVCFHRPASEAAGLAGDSIFEFLRTLHMFSAAAELIFLIFSCKGPISWQKSIQAATPDRSASRPRLGSAAPSFSLAQSGATQLVTCFFSFSFLMVSIPLHLISQHAQDQQRQRMEVHASQGTPSLLFPPVSTPKP